MYRIELGPEDIGVFRSIEEMATAIKTGVITSKARIYHSASDKWLPIEFHPHFKKAREMAAGPVAPAPVQSPPPRMEPVQPTRRTPLPEPSPVAGLSLIDVAAASRPAARAVAIEPVEHYEPARIPTPVAAPPPAPTIAPVAAPGPPPRVGPPPGRYIRAVAGTGPSAMDGPDPSGACTRSAASSRPGRDQADPGAGDLPRRT